MSNQENFGGFIGSPGSRFNIVEGNAVEIPFFVKRAERHKDIKKHLMENIYPEYEKAESNNSHEFANAYSDFFDGATKTDQSLFTEFYKNDINDLLTYLGFFRDGKTWNVFSQFWYNITKEGGYQEAHCHMGGPIPVQFSGVHYVEFDSNEHETLKFIHPMEKSMRSVIPSVDRSVVPDYFLQSTRMPNLEEGDVIFFPSWLTHVVTKQQSKKPRITVAINVTVTDDLTLELFGPHLTTKTNS